MSCRQPVDTAALFKEEWQNDDNFFNSEGALICIFACEQASGQFRTLSFAHTKLHEQKSAEEGAAKEGDCRNFPDHRTMSHVIRFHIY